MLGRSTLIHVCIKSLAESLFSFHTRPPNSTGGPEVLVGSTRPRHFRILSHGHGRPRFGHGRGVIEKGFLFRGPVLAGSTTRWGVPSLLGRRIHGTFNPSVFRYQKESCLCAACSCASMSRPPEAHWTSPQFQRNNHRTKTWFAAIAAGRQASVPRGPAAALWNHAWQGSVPVPQSRSSVLASSLVPETLEHSCVSLMEHLEGLTKRNTD